MAAYNWNNSHETWLAVVGVISPTEAAEEYTREADCTLEEWLANMAREAQNYGVVVDDGWPERAANLVRGALRVR